VRVKSGSASVSSRARTGPAKAGADPRDRLRDQARDGIDAEVVFPNKGLSM
jgi:hypothetical protein